MQIESHKTYTEASFSAYTSVVAGSSIEGGIQAKLKVFDSLQKNLYDVLEDNLAATVFKRFYEVPDYERKRREIEINVDRNLLSRVSNF